MTTITIEDAQAKLPEIIGGLSKGEELAITQGDRIVARLVGEPPERRQRLQPGFAKGMMTIVAEDEDHLKDFAEYMS
jgi:antitoxin (DNA-binding transcriptional repressor) of toxin-antitoxin stability system